MKLGLGTVQFGADYGISNPSGKIPLEEVKAILRIAQKNKVDIRDTASSYGESESAIGKALRDQHKFRIVTKTPVFKKKKITTIDAGILKTAFHMSLDKLKQSKVAGLLIHNADDILVEGGEMLISAMDELKREGLVDKIGVSVYDGGQIDRILERYEIDLIQLPVNALDQRLLDSNHLVKLKEVGVEIHARSVFLQGLLLMDIDQIPVFFDPIKPLLNKYKDFLNKNGLTIVDGAVCFIKGVDEIDHVIIGVNNAKQLKLNMEGFARSYNGLGYKDFKEFSINDPRYANPSQWLLGKIGYYKS